MKFRMVTAIAATAVSGLAAANPPNVQPPVVLGGSVPIGTDHIMATTPDGATWVAWLDNQWTNHIRLLVTYGPKYLAAEELEERLGAMLREYYRVLGGRLFRASGAGYWDFQKEALARAGRRLSWPSVVRGSVHVAIRKAVAWVSRSV